MMCCRTWKRSFKMNGNFAQKVQELNHITTSLSLKTTRNKMPAKKGGGALLPELPIRFLSYVYRLPVVL